MEYTWSCGLPNTRGPLWNLLFMKTCQHFDEYSVIIKKENCSEFMNRYIPYVIFEKSCFVGLHIGWGLWRRYVFRNRGS